MSAYEHTVALDISNIDSLVKPAEDFFEYANGNWIKKAEANHPPEYARWGLFEQLIERNNAILKDILENDLTSGTFEGNSNESKIGLLWQMCMDEAKLQSDDLAPLRNELKAIQKCQSKDALLEKVVELQQIGVKFFISISGEVDRKNSTWNAPHVGCSGLNLPDRDYFLEENERMRGIREKFVNFVNDIFQMISADDAAALGSNVSGTDILALETVLATATPTREDRRDPAKTYTKFATLSDLENHSSEALKWSTFMGLHHLKEEEYVIVENPEFLAAAAKLYETSSLAVLQSYVALQFVLWASAYVAPRLEERVFDFMGRTLSGQAEMKVRWKRSLNIVNAMLGEALGVCFVGKVMQPEAKARALTIVQEISGAFGKRLDNVAAQWMSEATRARAHEKLAGFGCKIGYPDIWRDFSDLELTDCQSLLNIARKCCHFNHAWERSLWHRPVQKHLWEMLPQTLNAYFHPERNEIVFPAAILQAPFFDASCDVAVNFGAFGAVAAHEVTHGFDDQGRQYNAHGELEDWWTEEDAVAFKSRAEVLRTQFDGFKICGENVNGAFCLGENLADLGGLAIAYEALQNYLQKHPEENVSIDGFTPSQRFFLSWAQVWRSIITQENALMRLKADPHAPAQWRVNGPLRNMTEFYEAFSIAPGSFMHLEETDRCGIW
jgi:putative endopeptidase